METLAIAFLAGFGWTFGAGHGLLALLWVWKRFRHRVLPPQGTGTPSTATLTVNFTVSI